MTNERVSTIIDYDVASCPKCNKAHHFKLKALVRRQAEAPVPIFGGAAETEQKSERESKVLFTCPETSTRFTYSVPNPVEGEIISVASEADIAAAANVASAPPSSKGDFEEWAKKSRDIALDFCKTMLSASTGGIPIYFAVLKYIGFEKISGTALSKLSILPPVLFLLAAILYVLALRPRHELVAPSDFNAFRKRRLEQLNQFIIRGTATFIGAVGLAIVMLFYTLSN